MLKPEVTISGSMSLPVDKSDFKPKSDGFSVNLRKCNFRIFGNQNTARNNVLARAKPNSKLLGITVQSYDESLLVSSRMVNRAKRENRLQTRRPSSGELNSS